MIEIYFKTIRDEELQKIEGFKIGSWVHVDAATISDLQEIKKITQLEMSDLKDSLDKHEIPRIEQIEGNILIFVRYPEEEEIGMHTTTFAVILTSNYLITISPQESKLVDTLTQTRLKLATTQKSKMLLYILLRITQNFTLKIKRVRYTVIAQEEKMKTVTSEAIKILTKNEETLNQYLSALVPLRNVLEAIASGRYVNLYEKDYDLLQDLLIAIKQSEDLCRVNVRSIRSLRDSYQILFTNDVNKTMKLLTAITIIFTIPTIISSIYGMNVKLPLEKNPFAFLIIINVIIVMSIVSLVVFIRKRWM